MTGFAPNTAFSATVTMPNGQRVAIATKADDQGYADLHWYALDDEPLGQYKVALRGGGQTFNGAFEVVAAEQPHVVVQPRVAEAGAPIIVSGAGLEVDETVQLGRYRSTGVVAGQVTFALVDTAQIQTGGIGGFQQIMRTSGSTKGELYLVAVFRPASQNRSLRPFTA